MAQSEEQKRKIQEMLAKLKSRGQISAAAATQAVQDVKSVARVDLTNIIGNASLDEPAAQEAVEETLVAAYGPAASNPSAAEQLEPSHVSEPAQGLILQRKVVGVARDDITLNAKQQEAADRIAAGEDVVILGRAGTGKTTSMRQSIKALIASGRIPPMSEPTKYLQQGLPGVAVVSFTNKATNNIRHAMPDDVKAHTVTIHKLLEFAPIKYMDEDGKQTMSFEPTRNRYRPLPATLKAIAFEESSMIGNDLHELLLAALPHKCQMIYLGDIRQLPPVFDTAVLGFKMLQLPVIELTEVYRQALLSPILRCALTLDDGKIAEFQPGTPTTKDGRKTWPGLDKWNLTSEHGTLIIQPWQREVHAERAVNNMALFFEESWKRGTYNPNEDIILCPHGAEYGLKSGNYLVSAANINKKIANFLGKARGAVIYEVIAGFNKHYFAVGDRVLYEKEDAVITRITRNGTYMGKPAEYPSDKMDRWGNLDGIAPTVQDSGTIFDSEDEFNAVEDIDALLDSIGNSDSEERVNQASAIIDVYIPSLDCTETLNSAKEINDLLFGYALTVHKSQGSEYDRVFCVFHQSHKTQLTRELVYTAFTRAKKHLHVFCPPDALARACKNQSIKGNTLQEKALFFKGKMDKHAAEKELFEIQNKKIDQNKLTVQTAVDVAVDKLKAAFPDRRFDLQIQVLFMDCGNAAGVAVMTNTEKVYLKISPTYLHADIDDMLLATIPHEVAHLYANRWFGCKDHGPDWKAVDAAAGGNGEQFHNLGPAAALR